jgi:hypothetical protein
MPKVPNRLPIPEKRTYRSGDAADERGRLRPKQPVRRQIKPITANCLLIGLVQTLHYPVGGRMTRPLLRIRRRLLANRSSLNLLLVFTSGRSNRVP